MLPLAETRSRAVSTVMLTMQCFTLWHNVTVTTANMNAHVCTPPVVHGATARRVGLKKTLSSQDEDLSQKQSELRDDEEERCSTLLVISSIDSSCDVSILHTEHYSRRLSVSARLKRTQSNEASLLQMMPVVTNFTTELSG